MDDVLNKFEQIERDINAGVNEDIATAGGGAREIGNTAIEWATHVILFGENRLIDAHIALKSDPATRGPRNIVQRNTQNRINAFKKDIESIEEALNLAIEANNDDDVESYEAQLYRAKLGLKTYTDKKAATRK